MTAQPNPTLFYSTTPGQDQTKALMRPNVTEHFWGYEVRANEQVIDIAVLTRGLCGFLSLTSFVAAAGIWFVPAMSFIGNAGVAKTFAAALLICLAFVTARIASRGTSVRVQIDTSAGELREVVDGPMNNDIVLARYGFDAVENINIVAARTNRIFGQVQVTIKDVGCVPVGDGSLMLLGPLRSRLAGDLGLDTFGAAKETDWSGPLVA